MSTEMENDAEEKIKIRAELANLSFEELKKLKERLGAKVYNEAVFGVESKKRKSKKESFKRENKNRPREISSKKPVPLRKEVTPVQDNAPRDPRFDSLCGTYNPKGFNRSYSFLKDVRAEELKELKKELKETENLDRQEQIKYLIQRIENKNREESKNEEKLYKQKMENLERISSMKEGNQPRFVNKSEKKVVNLVEQYEELKNSGNLEKHISKHRKRNAQKAKKNVNFL